MGSTRSNGAPTVSVVVCTYNRSNVLPRALDACRAQTFSDFELLVIDDGSTDDTATVVSRFDDPRIRYLAIENRGLSGARNFGIEHAIGEYMVFLDDDDRPDVDWLAALVSSVETGRLLGCGGLRYVTPDGELIGEQIPQKLGPAFFEATVLLRAGSFIIDRQLLLDVGCFETRVQCSHHTELSFRVLAALAERGETPGVVDRPLVTIERRPSAERRRDDPAVKLAATTFMLREHAEHFARSPRLASTYWSIAGVSAARLGDLALARRYFSKSAQLRLRPRVLAHFAAASVPPVGRRVWKGGPSLALSSGEL